LKGYNAYEILASLATIISFITIVINLGVKRTATHWIKIS
jgi:hypothetical protein